MRQVWRDGKAVRPVAYYWAVLALVFAGKQVFDDHLLSALFWLAWLLLMSWGMVWQGAMDHRSHVKRDEQEDRINEVVREVRILSYRLPS